MDTPDSSLAMLQSIDTIAKRGEAEACYALLLAQATYRNEHSPVSDISIEGRRTIGGTYR